MNTTKRLREVLGQIVNLIGKETAKGKSLKVGAYSVSVKTDDKIEVNDEKVINYFADMIPSKLDETVKPAVKVTLTLSAADFINLEAILNKSETQLTLPSVKMSIVKDEAKTLYTTSKAKLQEEVKDTMSVIDGSKDVIEDIAIPKIITLCDEVNKTTVTIK